MTGDFQEFAAEDFCYLTTVGRVTGRDHTIEIWFALHGPTLYMLSGAGDKSDWVKNALRHPAVNVRIKETIFAGEARPVHDTEEDNLARDLVVAKYESTEDDLSDWKLTSYVLAVDLSVASS